MHSATDEHKGSGLPPSVRPEILGVLSLGEFELNCSSTLLLSALLLAGFASCPRL